ncbi:MAG: hypothetical protein AAF569_01470, partial [Pseudomonadota bacterium]
MSETQPELTGVELLEAFNKAATLLKLTEQEQKQALGFEANTEMTVSTILAESRDAQDRANSTIEIANDLLEIAGKLAGQRNVSELISEFFSSHQGLVETLKEYDRTERHSQIK